MNKRAFLILAFTPLLSPALFGGWSEMQRLTYRGNEINPQVVVRNDTVHVMWEQVSGAVSYIRSIDNGLTWGDVIDLTENGHTGTRANIVITEGYLVTGWMDDNGAIALRYSANGSNWNAPIYKYTIDSQRYTFQCMAASGDTIYVAYWSSIRDSTDLMPYKFLRSPDCGQTWSNLLTIGHNFISTLNMVLLFANNYLLLAISTETGPGGFHILGYVSNNYGQTWSDTIWISPRILPIAQQPCISYNQINGQFAVGYMDYRYQQYAFYGDIFIRISGDDPSQWISESQVTDEHTSKYPSVSFIGTSLKTVWADRRYYSAGNDEIFFNSSEDGGYSWDNPQRLTNTQSKSIYPSIFNVLDTIHVVWFEDDTTGNNSSDIYYINYIPDSSDIINTNNLPPSLFTIYAYPNPFNSTLSIDISAEKPGDVYISDILGRFITELKYPKGISTIKWDATDKTGKTLPSGAYFIKNKGGGFKDVLEVMYLK
jgi:hypothetical protein